MADAYDLDERLPAALLAAHVADHPRMNEKRRRSLLGLAVRELDPSTRDLEYYAPKPRGGNDDMPRNDAAERARDAVNDDRRSMSDLEEDIQANVRALHREAAIVERPKLDELAELIGSLTYGEMIEWCQGCLDVKDFKPPTNADEWASIQHRWFKERSGVK